MRGVYSTLGAYFCLSTFCVFGQMADLPDVYAAPYPTRNEGPSIEFGQQYQDVSPNMPNPMQGAIQVKPKVEHPEDESGKKEAVVTAEIKGLDQIKADGAPGLTGVVTGIELLKSEDFQKKLQPYFGRSATLSVLDKICRDVIEYYRGEGFPVVNVVVPRQTVREGVIQFLVMEAHVGKVIVEA